MFINFTYVLVSRVSDFVTQLNRISGVPAGIKREKRLVPQNTEQRDSISDTEPVLRNYQPKSKKNRHPHILKDFLQTFATQDKQFQIKNEFNELNLLDDMYHVTKFERCNFQEPDLDR